ncbi:MAG: dephospho-CoA kinase [Deltaproteobacteria bacterium]|nr:dephospho-CoA kinase [Deltaproteobacteria bacterium]
MNASRSHTPPVVALTGSIGSGKSQAALLFEQCGAEIIDADVLAREAVKPGSRGLREISEKFGAEYLTASGELDRPKLAALVFSDESRRRELEDILHPRIRELYLAELANLTSRSPQATLIIYVVPLLFESRYSYPEVKSIVVVSAGKQISIERIMKRDSLSEEQALKRYNSQIPIEQKERNADFVLKNEGTLAELKVKVQELYHTLANRP